MTLHRVTTATSNHLIKNILIEISQVLAMPCPARIVNVRIAQMNAVAQILHQRIAIISVP
jgi:tartrate dehydratase alpha subunit/fumarate hydratase class I-like protein